MNKVSAGLISLSLKFFIENLTIYQVTTTTILHHLI